MTEASPARQIMIVDDELDSLRALELLLQQWGYATISYQRFEDARAALTTLTPDALISDIRLGQHNGLQLVNLARQAHPDMVIVAVSGYDDPVLREEAAMARAAYLLKPIELKRLRDYLPTPTAD